MKNPRKPRQLAFILDLLLEEIAVLSNKMKDLRRNKPLTNTIDIVFAAVIAIFLFGAVAMLAVGMEARGEVVFKQIEANPGFHTWSSPDKTCADVTASSSLKAECTGYPPQDKCSALTFTITAEMESDNGVKCADVREINHGRFFAPRARYVLQNAPGSANPLPCHTEVILSRDAALGFTVHAAAGVFPTRGAAAGRWSFEVRTDGEPAKLALDEVTYTAHTADDGTLARARSFRTEAPNETAVFRLCEEITVQALYGADAFLNGPLSYASTAHRSEVSLRVVQ